MLCKDCPHFHIRCNYLNEYNWGEAVCDKHGLVTDFRTKKKFETLRCVEEEWERFDGMGRRDRMAATRLTGKILDGPGKYWICGDAKKATTKLGEYEDTGLTPKQVRLLVDAVPELVRDIKGESRN